MFHQKTSQLKGGCEEPIVNSYEGRKVSVDFDLLSNNLQSIWLVTDLQWS